MSQSKIENKPSVLKYKSSIKIIGKFSPNIDINKQVSEGYVELKLNPQTYIFCPQLDQKPTQYVPMAKKIYVQGNFIAIIDLLDNLWFISQLFPSPFNISALLSKKVKTIFLSEGQCIISNKKNPILLNWGAKKIFDVSNLEIIKTNEKVSRNVGNFFHAYTLPSNKDDKFYYSNMKKVDNSNKLYQIKIQNTNEQIRKGFKKSKFQIKIKNLNQNEPNSQLLYTIDAFPTYDSLIMKNKVVGISVGKYHCMCWDVTGSLYTWGNRSIALGYQELPHQKITTIPKLVKKLNKFVTMGFAATHYSLALSSDGNIYEWGIKQQPNQLNEQLIFDPKVLKVGQRNSKIIMLKGKQNKIACLNSRHQLYLWGERAGKYLQQIKYIEVKFKNNNIYEPFLVPLQKEDNIIDFDMGDQFIAVLTSNSNSQIMADQQKTYWNDMMKKIKLKLKISNSVKTQSVQIVNEQKQLDSYRKSSSQMNSITPIQYLQNNGQYMTNVQKSYRQRSLKKQYFESLKSQDKFYINLLKNTKDYQINFNQVNQQKYQKQLDNLRTSMKFQSDRQSKFNIRQSLTETKTLFVQRSTTSRLKKSSSKQNCFAKTPTNQTKQQFFKKTHLSQKDKPNDFLNELALKIKQNKNMNKRKEKETNENMRISKFFLLNKNQSQSYQQRLQRVRNKKQLIQNDFNIRISKRIQEGSVQFRKFRHQQIVQEKVLQKNRNILKLTLQSFLIKHYLVRMITAPMQEGRKIKIQQFGKSLHLTRIQKNLRKIFIKARINFGLNKLKKLNFFRFAIVCHVWKKFIKKRRQQKAVNMRKLIAQQLFKSVLKLKIRFGISKAHLNTRKLQKFREWLVMTKNQRVKCLKVLWKNHLLSIMKINNQSQTVGVSKSQQNCTFESLYKQKLVLNPMLKLQTFLEKSPIFQLRYEYFQSIIFLFRKDNKSKSQKMLKSIKSARRKQRIKFSGQGEVVTINNCFQNTNDLLPYSLHYNLLVRPKSMQINIPQNMKKSEKWIQQQRNIFQKCLKQVLLNYEKNLLKVKRKYDIDLAYFIRQKYDSLAQKRWKYLIQYNKIKKTPYKKKRQKQLYRIFDLIGMQKVLDDDCLPEKYLMLQQALKKKDAPTLPNSYITFGMSQFKDIFKKYYDIILIRSKQVRKNFV